MSNTVDRRIVEMQFDNRDFENNVKDSIESLDELKKSLELEESAKELRAFEKTANKFSLDSLASAAEAVTGKFSILGTVGDQVLRRLTDAAMNAAGKMKNFIESLTIQPVSTGFQEYETQINAIQTILSNTRDSLTKQGYSDAERLELVNDRLDQLNHYADKTIYNFTEMTKNIGTFTAAGVELDTAVSSIQGIANLAAVSGSTSEQASRGMYQLSQAISTGTVKLMDWNSVVNAGMGGELFQKALLRTAKAMGVTVEDTVTKTNKAGKKVKTTVKRTAEEMVEASGSFRDSLSSGWLTSDVLTATLEQFSWDFEQMAKDMGYTAENMEEGIARAMEMKKGELLAEGYTTEEADEIMQLAQDATDAATKVKTFTQLFDTLKEAAQSGWTQTWEYIIGDFEQAKETLTSISNFFGKIIDSSAEARNTIFKEWNEAGGRDMLWNFDENEGPLGAFWNLVYGIQNIVSMIREEFEKVFPPATGEMLLSFTSKIQDATASFKEWTENSEGMEKIRRIVAGIAAVFDVVKTAIGHAWENFKKLLGLASGVGDGFLGMAAGVGDWLVKMRDSIKTSEAVQTFLKRLSTATEAVRGVVVSAFKSVRDWIGKLWAKIKDSGIFTKVGQGISDFVGKIPDAIAKLKEWIKGIVEYVKNSETLQKVWAKIKEFFGIGVDIVTDFGKRLGTALKNFFTKDVSGEESLWGRLKARLSAFGSGFSDWFGTVKETVTKVWGQIKDFLSNFFTNTIPNFFNSAVSGAGDIVSKIQSVDWAKIIKTALGIYAGIKVLSSLGGLKSIGTGLKKLAGGLKDIGKGIKNVAKNGIEITHKNKDSIGNTLLKIAASIGILVGSIYLLSTMDAGSLKKGFGLLAALAAGLIAVSFAFSKMDLDGDSILKVAAAVLLLVIPIKLLGEMDTAKALKGVIGIGVILTELAIFMRLGKKGFTGKTAFISLGIALNLLVLAVKNLAALDTGTMTKALIGMGALMLEMGVFMKTTSGLKKAGGLITMAIAINLLVTAVKRLGRMKTENLAKGVLGLSGVMIAFGVMAKLTKGMKLGSSIVTLLTMAGTMLIFVEMFKQIDDLNADSMVKFALSFSATILAMSVAMKIISTIPITGALVGLAAFAILIAGVGAIVIGLGYLASQWSGMTQYLSAGSDILSAIGGALGRFVGSIAAGFVEGLDLPQLGSDLSAFMTNASGFIEGAKNIDGTVAAGVGNLAAALLIIGGTELVNALIAIFGGENPVVSFADDLKTLAKGLKDYATEISGFSELASENDITSSVTAAKGLSDAVSNLPSTGGKLQEWIGWSNLSLFATDIVRLAEGLKSYASSVNGFAQLSAEGDLDQSIVTAQALSRLNNSLPKTGGKLQEWLGYQDLALFSENIIKLADGLVAYATKIKGFASIASKDDLDGASTLAGGLSDLNNSLPKTGSTLLNWVVGGVDLSLFSENIVKLADGLVAYATKIKGFASIASKDDLDGASTLAGGLSDLNNSLPKTGSTLLNWVVGGVDLSLFSDNIVKLAGGLMAYATEIDGFSDLVSEDDRTAAIETAKGLSDLNNSLPETGSTLKKWCTGEVNMDLFATNIGKLGGGLKSFADNIGNVSYEKSDEALSVLDMINSFTSELDKTGGVGELIDKFFNGSSENTLVSQTENMVIVGQNLSDFCKKIENVKADETTDTFAVLDTMTKFFEQINGEDGGVWGSLETFFGGSKEETLVSYSAAMVTVGENLTKFSNTLTGIDYTKSEEAIGVMDIVNDFVSSLDEEGGVWNSIGNFFNGEKDIVGLSQQMADMGVNLKTFSDNISDADFSNTDAISTVFTDMQTLIGQLDTTGGVWDDIGKWFGGKKDIVGLSQKMASFGTNFGTFSIGIAGASQTSTEFEYVKTIITAFSDLATAIENGEIDADAIESMASTIGSSFVTCITTALGDGTGGIETAAINLSDAGSEGANGTYDTWKTSGSFLATGLANGISAMTGIIKTAATTAASGAIHAIQIAWSIHSPSRVGQELGMYFDLGIAGGLETYSKIVSSQAADMGQSVVDSASTMLRGTDGSIFDNLDPNPTIRPVMDLTNIQNGVGTINGLFNSNRMVGQGLFRGMNFTSGVGHLNFDGSRIIGSVSNKDVVSELQSLAGRFDNLNNAVTNMKIVLDSGELVGATSRQMDNQLGELAMRRGRGN